MELNIELIMEIVKPYLNNNTITYQEFENLFKMLNHKEQYKVSDVLFKNDIILIDEFDQDEVEEVNSVIEATTPDAALFQDKVEYNDVNLKSELSNETLCLLFHKGDKSALETLCVKNERLVYKCAKTYLHMFKTDLDLEDLKQYGMIGLIKAAEKFKTDENFLFSTYAVYWIKQVIKRNVIDNGNIIRLPVYLMDAVLKVKRINDDYSVDELMPQEKIGKICEMSGLNKEKVALCFELFNKYLNWSSLNDYVKTDGDSEVIDFIADKSLSIQKQLNEKLLHETIDRVLSGLTPREERVLRLRYGIDVGRCRTLEEIGNEYNLTRERIRQIEAKALRKLKHPTRANLLKDYYKEY